MINLSYKTLQCKKEIPIESEHGLQIRRGSLTSVISSINPLKNKKLRRTSSVDTTASEISRLCRFNLNDFASKNALILFYSWWFESI